MNDSQSCLKNMKDPLIFNKLAEVLSVLKNSVEEQLQEKGIEISSLLDIFKCPNDTAYLCVKVHINDCLIDKYKLLVEKVYAFRSNSEPIIIKERFTLTHICNNKKTFAKDLKEAINKIYL